MTDWEKDLAIQYMISIHTALAGCDADIIAYKLVPEDFNPHSPRRL